MNFLHRRIRRSPTFARVAPFAVFLGFTVLQEYLGGPAAYWCYAVKTIVGAYLLALVWPEISELRWRLSVRSVAAGIALAAVWIGSSHGWMTQSGLWHGLGLFSTEPAVAVGPFVEFSGGNLLAPFFIAVHLIGATLIVPPIEEMFYRSFVYRYLQSENFSTLPLNGISRRPFILTAVLFGIAHDEWLAGILCGLAFQWFVTRRGDLGEAISAHATANLVLGVWVVYRGAWGLW